MKTPTSTPIEWAMIMSLMAIVGIAIIVFLNVTGIFGINNGIIPHPSGQAVYLEGEACVVNHVETREEYSDLLHWCIDLYDNNQPLPNP